MSCQIDVEHTAPSNSVPGPVTQVSPITNSRNTPFDNDVASLISMTNKIIALSQKLLIQMLKPEVVSNTVTSLHMVHSHLFMVVTSAAGNGKQLPEKKDIAPNQLSKPQTAKEMGVKQGNKKCNKVDSAHTAVLISEINCECNCNDENNYGAGSNLGNMQSLIHAQSQQMPEHVL